MPYDLVIVRSAERELKSLTSEVARRVGTKMRLLREDQYPAQAKRLKGSAHFRLRVGDYRIIYSVDDESHTVTIRAAGHRREVYRKL